MYGDTIHIDCIDRFSVPLDSTYVLFHIEGLSLSLSISDGFCSGKPSVPCPFSNQLWAMFNFTLCVHRGEDYSSRDGCFAQLAIHVEECPTRNGNMLTNS